MWKAWEEQEKRALWTAEINRVTKERKALEQTRKKEKTKYVKTALQIAKNGTPKDRKAKEQARAEKANSWTDPSSANCLEDNHSRKEMGGRWIRKNSVKKSYPEERKAPYIRESSNTKQ